MAPMKIKQLRSEGASYVAEYEWQTYRFLLTNGNFIDVQAASDDSTLRTEVLKIANKTDKAPSSGKFDIGIAGSTALPEPEAKEAPKPAKKVAAKKTAAKKAAS